MRILIIQPWISYRGSETVSVLQAYYLKKLGHRAAIACLYIDRDRKPFYCDDVDFILPSETFSELFARSKIFFYLFSMPFLFFLVMRSAKNFEILNAHNLPSIWIAALTNKIRKRRVVWTSHGVPPKSGFESNTISMFFWNTIFGFIDQWAVKSCDVIIAVSKKTAQEIKKVYGKKAQVIYPPIESKLYRYGDSRKIRKKFSVSPKAPLLLHVSRINKSKQPDLTLKAFVLARKKINNLHLMFVGQVDDQDWLINIARKHSVSDKVILAGFVKPTKLKHFFAACDLNIAPSWKTEACPAVPLQALAAGKFSIVAKSSGVDEIIGDSSFGLVVQPNVQSVSDGIVHYFSNEKNWNRLSKKGRLFVTQNFSGESYAKQFLRVV